MLQFPQRTPEETAAIRERISEKQEAALYAKLKYKFPAPEVATPKISIKAPIQPINKGEAYYKVKMTLELAKEIRVHYATGGTSLRQLGKNYGQSNVSICYIIHNEIWFDPDYTPPTKQSRLNQEQRQKVIKLYKQGNTNQQTIAKLYNVSQQTICNIIHKGK